MSKDDEMGAAKAALAKRRRISQAPPPTEPLPRGSYVAPANAEFDRPAAEIQQKNSRAEFDFQLAERHCYEAIGKLRNIKRVDQKTAAYEAKRWSRVLRPEIKRAFIACTDVGMPADKLKGLKRRMKKVDDEFSLAHDLRQSVSPKPVPIAMADDEKKATNALATHLKNNPNLKKGFIARSCG